MDNEVSMLAKKVELKLELKCCSRKCEYCDWSPMCCEWCGKTKNNKRKSIIERNINKKEKRNKSISTNFFLFLAKKINIMEELRKTSTYDLINV